MKSKLVLFTSIFVTVFILLTAAGIAYAVWDPASQPAVAQNTAATPASAQTADLAQQFAGREAEYQKLIAEANQRIETLNNEVTSLQQQPQQQPAAASPAVTADKAAQIAMAEAGENEALQSMPELVDYQGTNAFEVSLSDGKVYVDAKKGTILFNGVVKPITSQQAGDIAGQYLGGMDPKYASIKLINFNGTQIYQVVFSGDKEYIVYIDLKGNVLKAQIYQYSGGSGGGGATTGSSAAGEGVEHESD